MMEGNLKSTEDQHSSDASLPNVPLKRLKGSSYRTPVATSAGIRYTARLSRLDQHRNSAESTRQSLTFDRHALVEICLSGSSPPRPAMSVATASKFFGMPGSSGTLHHHQRQLNCLRQRSNLVSSVRTDRPVDEGATKRTVGKPAYSKPLALPHAGD